MRAFFQRNAVLILLTGLFIVAGITYVVVVSNQQTEVAQQLARISELDTRMQTQLAHAKAAEQAAVDEAQGTSAQRVDADTEVIKSFVRTAVTWDSGEGYASARESVMRKYGLDEQSQFMSVYFPPPVFNTDSSGNRVYLVDAEGINSALTSVDARVLGVEGTRYRYLVMANIRASSTDGKASANRPSVVFLTVDGEGHISDVSGYASVTDPLTSQ
ncbi:hypothetical protein ANMWB30_23220 [Arthrobacter sp. MWB30]|nr:hypothetical protein ANMWB30_23220 [Arthrobacter sp. MWB30]